MKAATPFRICAVILVLLAIGHTAGFLTFKPSSISGLAVRAAMKDVTFPFGGSTRSYSDFYRGFGLFVSVAVLFSALVAWQLPKLLVSARESFQVIGTAFVAAQLCNLALSLVFFALPQAVFALLIVSSAVWGMVLASRSPTGAVIAGAVRSAGAG